MTMSSPIYYASSEEIEDGVGRISLHGTEARYLMKSIRIKSGESILIGNGKGMRYEATVTSVEPDEVSARIESRTRIERERPALTLIQALSRTQQMDETIARAAEVGTQRVVPFVAPRSPATSSEKLESRMERWKRVAREASKVARRAWPLEVENMVAWPPDISVLSRQELNVVLWEEERSTDFAKVLPAETPATVGILVGPEGGFSETEVRLLEGLGCVKASMGDLIFRTETAGSYAVMIVRYHYGILRPIGA
jgi:16S rRNA (uracil1498-N3)-methyltransferase